MFKNSPGSFGTVRHLGITLGDVDDLDADRARECRPVLARLGIAGIDLEVSGKVYERLLDEVLHETGIRAVREHGGRLRILVLYLAQRENFLAQRVNGAVRRRQGRTRVTTPPRLDAGVEVQGAMLPAPLDESDRGNVNGHVHDEVATTNHRLKHLAEILAGQGLLHEADAVFLRFLATDIVSRDDRDPFGS